ncbi:hypothetical protein GQX74_004998 [Glossina fuscipes]|nr:hypothetical protein GQX74_004998 [Glossina fuscipes]
MDKILPPRTMWNQLNQDGRHTFKIVHIPKAESRYPSYRNTSSRFLPFFCDIKRNASECMTRQSRLRYRDHEAIMWNLRIHVNSNSNKFCKP